eukprot:CAMPEP_0197698508 /NCGR_PEP_ID=MMETSP1338-20131121/119432_1 /TAXON_ID=43686 ORGANISM="Pelagodinium beii, Strain RCC1491" /NCGR_SAMPLE_ID=MMETSP1338 /ASSEMBLY_ACC=CAM_ASM_000754 /LENGTH=50 /DNA_ID=CAMNT_0043281911 /DNA_START=7 /DNA_END=156 /DNA_ORIENTATION=-
MTRLASPKACRPQKDDLLLFSQCNLLQSQRHQGGQADDPAQPASRRMTKE